MSTFLKYGDIHVEPMDIGAEPGQNPLRVDGFHMGTSLGSNVMVLHRNHPSEEMGYLILCHIPSGLQVKITLPEDKEHFLSPEQMSSILQGHLSTQGCVDFAATLPRTASEKEAEGEDNV